MIGFVLLGMVITLILQTVAIWFCASWLGRIKPSSERLEGNEKT